MQKIQAISAVFTFLLMIFASAAIASEGKKILYIDSYHVGYPWSDGIEQGIRDTVEGKGVELQVYRMDTKRQTSEEHKQKVALEAKELIESFKPDVVIAADDNASKYIIQQYYSDSELPFVFAGVNWDASVYGFPTKNVTGMIEVAPIPQLLEQLSTFANGDRIGFIGPDLLTSRKEAENYKTVFGLDVNAHFAKDFDDWKAGFLKLQENVDKLIIDTDHGVYAEFKDEMQAFVLENTKIPTGSCYDFMAPYSLVVFAKLATEQGEWSAQTALEIINGKSPADIEIARNEQGKLILNGQIAESTGIELPFELIDAAENLVE